MDRLTLDKITGVILNKLLTPEAISSIAGAAGPMIAPLLSHVSPDAIAPALAGSLPDSVMLEIERILNEASYYHIDPKRVESC